MTEQSIIHLYKSMGAPYTILVSQAIRIFPSLPPPPFPRTCARGKIRMACETNTIHIYMYYTYIHVQCTCSLQHVYTFLDLLVLGMAHNKGVFINMEALISIAYQGNLEHESSDHYYTLSLVVHMHKHTQTHTPSPCLASYVSRCCMATCTYTHSMATIPGPG